VPSERLRCWAALALLASLFGQFQGEVRGNLSCLTLHGEAQGGAVVATYCVSVDADCDNGVFLRSSTRFRRRDIPATLSMTQGVSKKGEAGPHVACSLAAPLPFSRVQLTHQNFRK
jgi:hypothetical protein